MLFVFQKVTTILFEYFYQYLPLPKAVMEILNLSVAPGHDISGKKISSLSCFTYFGTWVKILMRLGNLSSLIFFLTWWNHRHCGLAHGAFGMGAQPWYAQLRAVGGLCYKGHDPTILGGRSPLQPSGASCWGNRGVLLNLLGLAWLRKGFSLKIASSGQVRNQRVAVGLKIVPI